MNLITKIIVSLALIGFGILTTFLINELEEVTVQLEKVTAHADLLEIELQECESASCCE